ncbi:cytochrome c heme lyase [Mycena olivaceomarginata]|nr:cytochrome c heme lyase [Mycena olivaceomarginata]
MGQTSSAMGPTNSAPPRASGSCPVDHKAAAAPLPPKLAECPVDHQALSARNQMPHLSQEAAPEQAQALPTSRTVSSIPRDPESKWEYPSPQQGDDIQLARFKGRPGEMSPKARIWMFAGWLMPSRFNTEPPFDRHDWVVRRPKTGEEVRYVIDYYSAPPERDGSPVFSLDVRPALDSFGSVKERIAAATQDAWAAVPGEQ